MRFFNFKTIAVLIFASLVACTESPEPIVTEQGVSADWILTNGQILTVDEEFSVMQAMAITEGRIVATGSDEDINALVGADTQRTDLAGQTVVPGLIDNHMHYVRASKQWYRQVRWDGVTSRAQALEMLAQRASELPEGEWVVVIGGWIYAQFQDNSELFTAEELGAAVPDTPVYIQEAYARGFVNTAALEAAGITTESEISGRGSIVKDNAGNLTGELVGAAMNLARAVIPEVADDVWDASLQASIQSMHKMGLTSVYDVGGNTVTPEFYQAVGRASDNNELSMRVFYSLNGQNSNNDTAEDIIAEMKSHTPDLDGLRFAQFGYGEQVYAPMRAGPARPGAAPWELSVEDLEKYRTIVTAAVENGWQLHEHSHVEEKIQTVLSVYEELSKTQAIADLRLTIAHANGISAESIERARDLGMVFALHSTSRNMTPEAAQRSGEAGTHIPPIKTIHELGAIWGLGSDSTTVASPNPFHALGWVVSGRSASGTRTFNENVSREAALAAHTRTNAYILFREHHLGSLEPGKLADFAVLNRDYLTVPEEEIENLYSVMTVVGGEVVYSAP
ncbi:MAG: amidohydrolase [Proteobacteria bacterium]|jgi:predicted amidohydrolase YtcJ|nr:amidohydrolase [Pseudomonadota bacterium]